MPPIQEIFDYKLRFSFLKPSSKSGIKRVEEGIHNLFKGLEIVQINPNLKSRPIRMQCSEIWINFCALTKIVFKYYDGS